MGDSWVTLQLPSSEETVEDALILNSVRSILPKLEVFFPWMHCKDKKGSYSYILIEGYLFVRGPYSDRDYLRLEDSTYVFKVLTFSNNTGKRTVAYTLDSQIEDMKGKLKAMVPSGFVPGDRVLVLSGVYSGLRGKIVNELDEVNVLVEVNMPLGSLVKLTPIARMFLAKDED